VSAGGEDYALFFGDYSAVITQVGGGVRLLRYGARDLVLSYGAEEVRPRYRGALLAPWANRIADGRYEFAGATHQLPLTEPERRTALHGLVCWERFDLVERDAASVTLEHELVPRTGYPFPLRIRTAYRLDEHGLSWEVATTNTGREPAPYGVSIHPYLVAGPGGVDRWELQVLAERYLEVTPDRLLPSELRSVEGTGFDFRGGRGLGDVVVDHAFTGLGGGPDGQARARLRDADGTGVVCTWDPQVLGWMQLHTADLPDPHENRRGLALEPMTGPPDCFNSGTDLVTLEPGASHTASWTIGAL
jgi:aldose 1-epimerase